MVKQPVRPGQRWLVKYEAQSELGRVVSAFGFGLKMTLIMTLLSRHSVLIFPGSIMPVAFAYYAFQKLRRTLHYCGRP